MAAEKADLLSKQVGCYFIANKWIPAETPEEVFARSGEREKINILNSHSMSRPKLRLFLL